MQISYTTPSTLHVRICAGEALAAKGGDGVSSDAYVRVTLAGKYPVKATKVGLVWRRQTPFDSQCGQMGSAASDRVGLGTHSCYKCVKYQMGGVLASLWVGTCTY